MQAKDSKRLSRSAPDVFGRTRPHGFQHAHTAIRRGCGAALLHELPFAPRPSPPARCERSLTLIGAFWVRRDAAHTHHAVGGGAAAAGGGALAPTWPALLAGLAGGGMADSPCLDVAGGGAGGAAPPLPRTGGAEEEEAAAVAGDAVGGGPLAMGPCDLASGTSEERACSATARAPRVRARAGCGERG